MYIVSVPGAMPEFPVPYILFPTFVAWLETPDEPLIRVNDFPENSEFVVSGAYPFEFVASTCATSTPAPVGSFPVPSRSIKSVSP